MDTSTVCRGVSERARAGDNRSFGRTNHLSAVVKSDVEAPNEVTANNHFSTKHTDDCRMVPRVSKLRNFDPAKGGGSKDARGIYPEGVRVYKSPPLLAAYFREYVLLAAWAVTALPPRAATRKRPRHPALTAVDGAGPDGSYWSGPAIDT